MVIFWAENGHLKGVSPAGRLRSSARSLRGAFGGCAMQGFSGVAAICKFPLLASRSGKVLTEREAGRGNASGDEGESGFSLRDEVPQRGGYALRSSS